MNDSNILDPMFSVQLVPDTLRNRFASVGRIDYVDGSTPPPPPIDLDSCESRLSRLKSEMILYDNDAPWNERLHNAISFMEEGAYLSINMTTMTRRITLARTISRKVDEGLRTVRYPTGFHLTDIKEMERRLVIVKGKIESFLGSR